MEKSPDAFRTISEVADLLETPPHVLRFWETRFPQVRPVKRAGGRRYYRPADIALLAGIRALLHDQGMTIRGVQKILREQGVRHVMDLPEAVVPAGAPAAIPPAQPPETAAPPAAAPGPTDLPERPDPPEAPGVEPVPEAADPLDLSADAASADAGEDVAGQAFAAPADLPDDAGQPGGVAEPAVLPGAEASSRPAPRLSLVSAAPPVPDPAAPPPEADPMPEDTAPQPEDAAMDPRQSDLFNHAAPPADSAPPPAPDSLPDPEPAAPADPARESVPPESATISLPDIAAEDPVPETGAAPTAAARLRRLGPAALGRHRAALLSVHARLTDLHRRQTAAARGRRG
ncbi:MerR family transcriptional regulator [Ruixingdingia sedimenti]|uniref:MerR family transcriptional regulator n=1 Tax=Ruixingdingia sedimenti TaxID=3073604 RepID=A0ABU1F5J8_9RHOB|nr:MerR family transcriptional regulator [Xinfangfangia sp. LG-4]MDR5651714.1 MerR family transcriptional regulator [Xinfangfangia sp. LG-4]